MEAKTKDERQDATSLVKGAKVLVVDDIEDNRDLLMNRLGRDGHEVFTAENGKVALEMLESGDFDLVLLDIMMPVMNGFQVLEEMKADTALQHIPVVVVSASTEEDGAIQCIRMGAEDYLSKPINRVLLKARVDACLQKKRLRDQERHYQRQLDTERRRSNELLEKLFPYPVVQRLKLDQTFDPQRYDNVAILFCDIVGFTPYCDEHQHEPEKVVASLQRLVEEFECIAKEFELEKIKTIGDAFMAAANISTSVTDPVLNCIQTGAEMLTAARAVPPHWDLRIGIHVGPVVAGVVGTQRYSFDIWGDTVNTAARVESHGTPGAVNVSGDAWQQVAHLCRGASSMVDVKGKGPLQIVRFKGFLDK